MNGYAAFVRKEWLESVRTYKLLIMLTVFLIFGILSPLTAKLLPDLLSRAGTEGVVITMPEPSALDAWAQFFKNTSQMGLFVTVILFSGGLSGEKSKGTLLIPLTKGLSRPAVVLSKFTVMALLWTVSYGLAFAVTLGYTVLLFPEGNVSSLAAAVSGLWLLGIFLLALLVLAGAWAGSGYGTLLITGGGLGLMLLANLIPGSGKANPLSLAGNALPLLKGAVRASELSGAAATAGIGSALLVAAAVVVFRKRPLP